MSSASETIAYFIPLKNQGGLKEKYPIDASPTTVGRHPSNKLSFVVDSVSRFHARVEYRDKQFLLTDLQSSNGTFVNGKKIQSAILNSGDIVLFGELEMKFMSAVDMDSHAEASTNSTVDLIASESEMPSRIISTKPGSDVEILTTNIEILKKSDKESIINAHKRLSSLYKLSEVLHSVNDEKSLLDKITDLIFEILPADRATILTRPFAKSKEFEPVIIRHRNPAIKSSKITISKTIIDKVVNEQISVLSLDAQTDNRFSAAESIIAHDIRSTMCIPIIAKSKVIGILHIDTKESVHAFNEEDLAFMTSMTNEIAIGLDNLRMRDEMIRTERMAAVGMTVTNIAHNIKNILLLSKGGTQLVSNGIDTKNWELINDSWDIVKRGMDKIAKLVSEMLNYSKTRKIVKVRTNINRLIEDVLCGVQESLNKKNVQLKREYDESLADSLLDEDGLMHALENLVVNASEAINHDHGMITVGTKLGDDNNLIIRVEDNGAGISKDNLERLFLPFFTTKGSAGTGLGLAMTKKEIEEMGGKIFCESEVGIGTTFYISVPFDITETITDDID